MFQEGSTGVRPRTNLFSFLCPHFLTYTKRIKTLRAKLYKGATSHLGGTRSPKSPLLPGSAAGGQGGPLGHFYGSWTAPLGLESVGICTDQTMAQTCWMDVNSYFVVIWIRAAIPLAPLGTQSPAPHVDTFVVNILRCLTESQVEFCCPHPLSDFGTCEWEATFQI